MSIFSHLGNHWWYNSWCSGAHITAGAGLSHTEEKVSITMYSKIKTLGLEQTHSKLCEEFELQIRMLELSSLI